MVHLLVRQKGDKGKMNLLYLTLFVPFKALLGGLTIPEKREI